MIRLKLLFSKIIVGSWIALFCMALFSPAYAEMTELEKKAASTLPFFLKIPPYETENLGDGLYSFRWGAYRNIFLVTDDGVIVTDPMGVDSAGVFRDEIAKITDQPVKYVVYSQSHWDHATGAGIFKDEGAKIIAHEKCAANIAERPNEGLLPPDITFSENYSVELGGESLDLYYFGPADDNCGIVIVPSVRPILYVTDTLNPATSQTIPWNPQVPDLYPYNVISFTRSVEKLGAERGLTEYIGGHVTFMQGADRKVAAYPSVGPFEQITEKRELYERLFAAVESEWRKGTPEADIPQAIVDQGQFRDLDLYSDINLWMFTRKIAAYYAGQAPEPQPYDVEVVIEPITEGLYAFRAGGIRSFFMVGDDGVLVVDPVSANVAGALRAKIAAITDKPVSHVVYSHSLNQRAIGGQIYKDEGARFVAHENCAANFADIPRRDIVQPDDVFSSNYSVSLGSRSLDLYYLGHHYDCSIVMITRPDNYLFVVGTVSPPEVAIPADASLLNIDVYNLPTFLSALENLAREEGVTMMIADQVVTFTGADGNEVVFGPTGSAAVIGGQKEFWEDLFRDVRKAHEDGIGGSRVGRYIDHEPYQHLRGYDKNVFPWVARRSMSVIFTGK